MFQEGNPSLILIWLGHLNWVWTLTNVRQFGCVRYLNSLMLPRGLVIEDAPSGLKSGRGAGAKTLAVCTSHVKEDLAKFNPDYIVKDLTRSAILHRIYQHS